MAPKAGQFSELLPRRQRKRNGAHLVERFSSRRSGTRRVSLLVCVCLAGEYGSLPKVYCFESQLVANANEAL